MNDHGKKLMFIVVGPSGVGKSSFLERIIQDVPVIKDAITCTTRSMREGEREGDPYFFLSREEFESRIKQGFFVEWAEVHGNLYGTPKSQIENAWKEGRVIIMDLDIQGAQSFRKEYPDEAVIIFIKPVSIDVLRQRILKREAEPPKNLDVRLKNAEKELSYADNFDYQVTNDDFEESYLQFKKIIDDCLKNS